jgi:polysaccharide biosynthesis protein PslJ
MSPRTAVEAVRARTGALAREPMVGSAARWLTVLVLAAVVGVVTSINAVAGLAVAGLVLAFGIFVVDPILIAVLVLPGTVLVQRVGGSSTNLSVTDLLTFAAALVCLFHVEWSRATYFRRFLQGILWYQAILILVVVAHPFKGDIVEWFHRFSYLAGAALVGWVVGYRGRARQSIRIFLWAASGLALLAVENSATHGFLPAQWGLYQKNTIGSVMWVAAVIAQLNPPWARVPKVEARVVEVLCLLGLLASQSRQAGILLVLAVGTAVLLNSNVQGRFKTLIFIGVPASALVYYSMSVMFQNNPKFNSVAIRFSQISAAMHVWHTSPVLGLGMRFYNLPQYLYVTAPPNSLIDNLASTGVIGSLAFVFLVVVTMRAMNALPRIYGTLGLVILLGHYVDGLFDTFWIGALSIPAFVIAGMSLGVADADPDQERVPDLLAEAASGRHRPAHRVARRPVRRPTVGAASPPVAPG